MANPMTARKALETVRRDVREISVSESEAVWQGAKWERAQQQERAIKILTAMVEAHEARNKALECAGTDDEFIAVLDAVQSTFSKLCALERGEEIQ